jgi:hypothetical protein
VFGVRDRLEVLQVGDKFKGLQVRGQQESVAGAASVSTMSCPACTYRCRFWS